MNLLSNQEIEQFWRALANWCERMEMRLIEMRDWQSLSRLQVIGQVLAQAASCDTSTLPKIAEIAPMLADFIFLELDEETPRLSHFAQRALEIFKSAERDIHQRHEALARRLYAMHQFLDGVSTNESFGSLQTSTNADIHYGLGVSLHDGSLLKLFTTLREKGGIDLEPLLTRTFEDEAPQLLDAIHAGQTSFEQFMQSHLILRYDSSLSRKVYDVSGVMQARFGRLAAEPAVQSAQIDLVAGDRFRTAFDHAQKTGIQSMRGFAMLFDLHRCASHEVVEETSRGLGESQKCLALADAVISRMQGHKAGHWQTRLQSVFQGVGNIDGRKYDETRFFGQNVACKAWDEIDFSLSDERLSPEPRAGKLYIVCPGDRLSDLTQRAYDGAGDYRQVLRQNPHIQMPEALVPGTRIYFPVDKDDHINGDDVEFCTNTAKISEDGTCIYYANRMIRSIWPLTEVQKKAFCESLNQLSATDLYHAMAVDFPEGSAIVCQQIMLILSDAHHARVLEEKKEATRMAREAQHSGAGAAYGAEGHIAKPPKQDTQTEWTVMTWLRQLAAEIRGDVVIQDRCLPLACLETQPHRQAWMATALKRVLSDEGAKPLGLVLHAKTRSVDVVDAHGVSVLRLENADFGAIRHQVGRRLGDYVAPPIVQMNTLSQLWLSDVMGLDAEIAVPPVSHANLYPVMQPDGEACFLVPMGTPVFPVMRGIVVDCGMFPGVGYGILMRHHGGLYVRYASLATVSVKRGEAVTAETMVGRSGHSYAALEPMFCVEMCLNDSSVSDWYGFEGTPVEYFDMVCHLWPHGGAFDVWMGD